LYGGVAQTAMPPKITACRRIPATAGLLFFRFAFLPDKVRREDIDCLFPKTVPYFRITFGIDVKSMDVDKTSTCVNKTSTHVDEISTRVKKKSTYVDKTSTHVDEISTCVKKKSTYVDEISTYVKKNPRTRMKYPHV
jgi:hypothetical protein